MMFWTRWTSAKAWITRIRDQRLICNLVLPYHGELSLRVIQRVDRFSEEEFRGGIQGKPGAMKHQHPGGWGKRRGSPVEELRCIQFFSLTAHQTHQLLYMALQYLEIAHPAFDELRSDKGAAV